MADKLSYIPNDNTYNYPFCRLQLVVEMFGHSTKWTNETKFKLPKVVKSANKKWNLGDECNRQLNVLSLPDAYSRNFFLHQTGSKQHRSLFFNCKQLDLFLCIHRILGVVTTSDTTSGYHSPQSNYLSRKIARLVDIWFNPPHPPPQEHREKGIMDCLLHLTQFF